MLVKQISIFLENKAGRLAEVTRVLADNQININALSIADTTDFGILRLIVNKPELAEQVLKSNGMAVSITNVIAVGVADKPGGLAVALDILDKANVGIEYMYAFVGKKSDEALVILRVEDIDKAVEQLKQNNILVIPSKVVYEM